MNSTYSLVPITVLVLLLYSLSWWFAKNKIIEPVTHRKVWNLILLVTFCVTGLIGILLVLQINYKLEIPYIKRFLQWHVSFGIAMFTVCIFHFGWHLRYYWQLIKSIKGHPSSIESPVFIQSPEVEDQAPGSLPKIKFSLVMLGFTAMLTQVIMLREYLTVFQGNEFVTAIIFACWMLLTGVGALAQSKIRLTNGFLILGILPIIMIACFYAGIIFFYPPGTQKGPIEVFLFSLIVFAPFCLLSGLLFTRIARIISEITGNSKSSTAYGLDAIGGLLAGLVSSFILLLYFRMTQILSLILLINIGLSIMQVSSKEKPRSTSHKYLLLIIPVCVLPYIFNLDNLLKSYIYINQQINIIKETPYGQIVVTSQADQKNYYENGVWLFSPGNDINNEESVHYAMVQHPNPKTVLVVSGGIQGISKEILKYPGIKSIYYLELNPWLSAIEISRNDSLDSRIQIIPMDLRRFLQKNKDPIDVAILNTPDPYNAALNRYFTMDIFQTISKVIGKQGILCISLSSTADYMSEEARMVNGSVYATLASIFSNVAIVPGEKNYFLASQKQLDIGISKLINSLHIENMYVNEFYLNDSLLFQKSKLIEGKIAHLKNVVNYDYKPIAYYFQIHYWLSYFKNGSWISGIILIALLGFIFYRSPWTGVGIFTNGLSGASMQFIILILCQLILGLMYQWIGLLMAAYMAGLAAGTWYGNKYLVHNHYQTFVLLQVILGFLCILLPFLIILLSRQQIHSGMLILSFLALSSFIFSFTSGVEFQVAASLTNNIVNGSISELYAVDLAGAALGTLATSIVLLPRIGIVGCGVTLSILSLAGAGFSYYSASKKK